MALIISTFRSIVVTDAWIKLLTKNLCIYVCIYLTPSDKILLTRPIVNIAVKKSISNELDITIHVIVSQLSGHCGVINDRLWRHEQNANPASDARGRCVKIVVWIVILSSSCRVRNEIMYVFSWQTVSALSRVLFWCLFPSLLRNSEN